MVVLLISSCVCAGVGGCAAESAVWASVSFVYNVWKKIIFAGYRASFVVVYVFLFLFALLFCFLFDSVFRVVELCVCVIGAFRLILTEKLSQLRTPFHVRRAECGWCWLML